MKWGSVGSQGQKDWEDYEEASLLRQKSAETAGDGKNEKMPFCVHSLPMYGT